MNERTLDPPLTKRSDGTYYDERLGVLVDDMYAFATRRGMDLEPLYLHGSNWLFQLDDGPLSRIIELQILEGRNYVQLTIIPGAIRDDEASRTRYFMKKPVRTYTLYLPIERPVFVQTLEMAYQDIMSFVREDLKDTGPPASQ